MSAGNDYFFRSGPSNRQNVVSKTTTYQALNSDDIIFMTSGSSWTLTLPASPIIGKPLTLVKTSSDANAITIGTINGGTRTLDFQNETAVIAWDGSAWQFLSWSNREKSVTLTVSGPAGWSTVRAIGVPYKTQDSTWRLKFNISGTKTAGNSATPAITGVVFFNGPRQSCSGNDNSGGTAPANIFATPNTNTVQLTFGANQTDVNFSGDVELNARPSLSL